MLAAWGVRRQGGDRQRVEGKRSPASIWGCCRMLMSMAMVERDRFTFFIYPHPALSVVDLKCFDFRYKASLQASIASVFR